MCVCVCCVHTLTVGSLLPRSLTAEKRQHCTGTGFPPNHCRYPPFINHGKVHNLTTTSSAFFFFCRYFPVDRTVKKKKTFKYYRSHTHKKTDRSRDWKAPKWQVSLLIGHTFIERTVHLGYLSMVSHWLVASKQANKMLPEQGSMRLWQRIKD